MSAVDWAQAAMTDAAAHHEDAVRIRVIVIPRGVFAQWGNTAWADLERAAFIGTDGLAPLVIAAADRPDADLAFMRSATSADRFLQGRSLLFKQGW